MWKRMATSALSMSLLAGGCGGGAEEGNRVTVAGSSRSTTSGTANSAPAPTRSGRVMVRVVRVSDVGGGARTPYAGAWLIAVPQARASELWIGAGQPAQGPSDLAHAAIGISGEAVASAGGVAGEADRNGLVTLAEASGPQTVCLAVSANPFRVVGCVAVAHLPDATIGHGEGGVTIEKS